MQRISEAAGPDLEKTIGCEIDTGEIDDAGKLGGEAGFLEQDAAVLENSAATAALGTASDLMRGGLADEAGLRIDENVAEGGSLKAEKGFGAGC